MAKVKMTFEVIEPLSSMIDKITLKNEFDNDIHKVAKYLYKEEGVWWDDMKLIKTELID